MMTSPLPKSALRVHAVVLTCDRPETLRRCVSTALSCLTTHDALTVLDDSCDVSQVANLAVLRDETPASQARLRHIPAARLAAIIRQERPDVAVWLDRTAARDIAPLRNLSLLLSALVPAQTTVLVDDDVCGFDLNRLHESVSTAARSGGTAIVGADISGANENDTVSRLSAALDLLDSRPTGDGEVTAQQLFFVPTSSPTGVDGPPRYVSGGYLAFRVASHRLFAFPPGYNEDWLWCLLQRAYTDTTICRSGEVVVHDPPCVRKTTQDDFRFELPGELVFDCLLAFTPNVSSNTVDILQSLAQFPLSPQLLPSFRARELSQRAARIHDSSHGLDLVREYGLGALDSMLTAGELDIDGSQVLSAWCRDAIVKQQAFSATLGDPVLMSLIGNIIEGRK